MRRREFTGDFTVVHEIDKVFRERQKNEPAEVCLLELKEPKAFVSFLPPDYQASQLNPGATLPANLWAGVVFRGGELRLVRELLDVRTRIRWIELDTDFTPRGGHEALDRLIKILGAWRCENCGHRGDGYRPVRCPHSKVLCGDARIVPQIQWIRVSPTAVVPRFYLDRFKTLGMVVSPDVPVVKELVLL